MSEAHPESSRLSLWLFGLASVAAAAPLWWVTYPPLQDLPQHLAAIRVLHSFDDPAFGLSAHFELHPLRTQYLAYYLAADWLAYLMPIRVANLVLVTATVVGLPWALRSLSRALGGDGAVGLFALPLTYNAHLILGFFNFLAAIPLCLYGLSLAVRHRRFGGRGSALGLAAIAVLCFLTHVVPFAFLALGAFLLAFGGGVRASLARLLPLVPAGLLGLVWLVRSPAGQATLAAAAGDAAAAAGDAAAAAAKGPDFRPTERALSELPMWMTDVFTGDADVQLLWAWLAVVVLGAALLLVPSLRMRTQAPASLRFRLWLLPCVAAALYFVAPSGYRWIWPIAPRFALLTCVFALVPWAPAQRTLQRLLLASGVCLSLAHSALAMRAFVGFEQEVGAFDDALSAIPSRRTVAGLIFARGSRHVRFSPFIHYVAYYQADKGGAVMFTFADFPQSPFVFRPDNRPPRVPPRWEWMPGRVQPSRDLADHYEYVLVRGGPGRIARERRTYELIHRSPRWSVWRRR